MITRLRIRNLLSLKDVTLHLSRFHIFLGPNAAGKSAIFKSLQLLSKLLHGTPLWSRTGPLVWDGARMGQLVWKGDVTLPISFEAWLDANESDTPDYLLEIRKVGEAWRVTREVLNSEGIDTAATPIVFDTQFHGTITWKVPYTATISTLTYPHRLDTIAAPVLRPFRELSDRVGSTWRYRVSAGDVAAAVRPPILAPGQFARRPFVDESGHGLAAVLQQVLQGERRPIFDSIQKQLNSWFPHIQSINLEPVPPSGVRLAFTTTRSSTPVPASMESDGVLHALFLIWRAFDVTPNDTICLEEPENATHPHRLRQRYEFLKKLATEGFSGYPVRTFVATHSPDFLNAVLVDDVLSKDLLRMVEFDPQQGTRVHTLKDLAELEALAGVFKGNLGEMWWTGALGGTRGE